MKQWWYVLDEQTTGPVTQSDLPLLVRQGVIGPGTLVWSPDMSEWRPVEAISELAAQLFVPPPLPTRGAAGSFDKANGSISPSSIPEAKPASVAAERSPVPWRRYLAKNLDIIAAILPFVGGQVALAHYSPRFAIWLSDPTNGMLLVVVGFCLTPFIEAFYSSAFGNTPGKALLGLSVARSDGEQLTYGGYAMRNLHVAWAGCGLFIPLFALITFIYQYRTLTSLGSTSYDLKRYVVNARQVSSLRFAGAVGLFVAVIVGSAALNVYTTDMDQQFYYGQKWTNPHTLATVDVPAGWIVAANSNNLGDPIYVFTRPRDELQVLLGFEAIAPTMTLGEYVTAFVRAVSKDMTLALPGEQTTIGSRRGWTVRGRMTADATERVTVTFLAQSKSIWRVVGLRFKGADPETEAHGILRDRLLASTASR